MPLRLIAGLPLAVSEALTQPNQPSDPSAFGARESLVTQIA